MPVIEPVTLQEAKQHCRVDCDADDELICGYITAAREWAESFLNKPLVRHEASTEHIEVKQIHRQAILLLVGHWYANREAASPQRPTEIPFGASYLLWSDRNVPV